MTPARKFRTLLGREQPVVASGVFDGLSARLAEAAGFGAIYASGGAIARAAGLPDLGILSLAEVLERVETIADAVDVPVIADADTGFGGSANVERTARLFERAGVAGFHIEDQAFPKRCGHLDDKSLIAAEEMCRKIRIVRNTLSDPDFLVIARTDAIAVEGFAAALDRAGAYVEAGADMIFVEAPETVAEIEEIARAVPGPKLINMFAGGKTPMVPRERLAALGYALVIIPSDLQRAAIRAMQRTLALIAEHGDSMTGMADMASFAERERIVDTARYLELDRL
jgi:2-methylisocitrate lyase-like PEP mutase family enzyme